MCGICGFITKKGYTIEMLNRMRDTMLHRGPDDAGSVIMQGYDNYIIGLAHRRLSVLDLSPLGHQPMFSNNERVGVVFNGEIYNFAEIKEELKYEYTFSSQCDTEVIIAAYLKWGIDCVNRFNGMFAIALYDRESESFYLIRDRAGKKPLYYWIDGENMVFSSELKAIIEIPEFPRILDNTVIKKFLVHQYIHAPYTIFNNVYKLEPGTILSFKNGKIEKHKYWDVAFVYTSKSKNLISDYQTAKHELKQLLMDAVRLRMIADVPVGTFLSGGYDSSLISAIAQSLSTVPMKTYSIGFYDKEKDEAPYAKKVAEYLGTEHTEYYIDEKEMLKLVESIPQFYDEPFADSSQIPSMLVAQLARKDVTVVLSGDGGDELFCGYNTYDHLILAQKVDMIAETLGKITNYNEKIISRFPQNVKLMIHNRDIETKTQFFLDPYYEVVDILLPSKENVKYPFESKYHTANWQNKRMLLDMDTYLPEDILCKVDRATMKVSLEARCPLLDYRVMEYSFQIPHKFKYYHNDKKHILKDITHDFVPKELLERPKMGFAVPLDKWMRGALWEQLTDYANEDYINRQGIFRSEDVNNFLKKYKNVGESNSPLTSSYSRIAWSFFVFQQWYCRYKSLL